MRRTVYRPSEALDLAIDVMSAIYATPPPDMPHAPWLVQGLDMRAIRRELRLSCAGPEAINFMVIEGLVRDLAVHRHRTVMFCLRKRSAVASTISLLYRMAEARLRAFLACRLTEDEFDQLDAVVQLLSSAPLTLVELPPVYDIADLLDLESSDPATVLVFDHPVGESMRRERVRSTQSIICPSGAPEHPARKGHTR